MAVLIIYWIINRFYDLNINPQANIYWNWAVNSQLQAKDNFENHHPFSLDAGQSLPTASPKLNPCNTNTCVNNTAPKVLVRHPVQQVDNSDSEYEY